MCRFFWKNKSPICDIAHIEWIYPDAYAFLKYSKRFDIKTVGVVHGNEAIGYLEDNTHRKYYKKALQSLDRVIAVSADLKQKMVTEYGVSDEKIRIIFNGVDLNKFPIIDRVEARKELGIQVECHLGVCVARLSVEKNLDFLLEAISFLREENIKVAIIGDGPLKNKLEVLRERLGIKDKVQFVGPIPHGEIYKWLNVADFFCLPSKREGCPVVIHEALACGAPIVATAVGAIPDLVPCEEYGLLCPPSDSKALSEIILKSLSMQWDREKIATYGRQFTWDKVARQTVDVFKDVLGKG
jgi:glycosyltransferase involved in cell wall biosynthesis